MGVLRIKESVDELLEKDPYDLFTVDEPHTLARRMRPEFWGAACIGLLLAFGVAFMTFLNVQQDAKESNDAPYAYFEVRAIDPDGRPVAGALVKEGERQLGVTDSFGEWRRFMRVRLGSTVRLAVSKRAGGTVLSAQKNVAVPAKLPEAGELELTGSVQLLPPGAKAVAKRKAAARKAEIAAAAAPAPKSQWTSVDDAEAAEARESAKEVASANAVSHAPVEAKPVAADVPAPAAPVAPATGDFASVWFMPDAQPTAAMTEVVQNLRRRSVELGMRVDPQSPWRMRLHELAVTAETHLIQVEGIKVDEAGAEERLFTYLRNFQETSLGTARDILWAATVHVARSHRVTRHGDAWVLDAASPRLWALSPGRVVIDQGGMPYNVVTDASGQVLQLAARDTEPCATGASCEVTTPGVARIPPNPGWQRLRLKVLGAEAGRTDVYVAGYEARKVQEKVYEFWGAPMGGANVTAVRAGRIVWRGKIQTGGATLPVVSLPGQAVSRKAPGAETL